MRFIRRLLICLLLLIVLAAAFVAAAFTSAVQTWYVERALARHPGLHGSVASVSAGLSSVQIVKLHLEHDGAVLTVPTLDATLPVKTALRDRSVLAQTLVAKGWTLDLSHWLAQPAAAAPEAEVAPSAEAAPSAPLAANATTAPAEAVATTAATRVFQGFLAGWALPCDTALDGVDLEGDVLVATQLAKEPLRVHVTIKGGGLAAGHAGDFEFDAASLVPNSGQAPDVMTAHGKVTVVLATPRTVGRAEFNGKLALSGGVLPDDLGVSAVIAKGDTTSRERYTIDLKLGDRHVALIEGQLPKAHDGFEGTWKVDFRDSEVARFFPDRELPAFATTGEGRFNVDPSLRQAHATGRLNSTVKGEGLLAPGADRPETLTVATDFGVRHAGQSLDFDRLSVTVSGARPIVEFQSLQPFGVNVKTGELRFTSPGAEWLEGSLRELPIGWLSGLVPGLGFQGGQVTGDVTVKATEGGFALKSKAPLVASSVTVQKDGRILVRGVDLSLELSVDRTQTGWQARAEPLLVASGGHAVATIQAQVAPRVERGRAYALTGQWTSDLAALSSQQVIPGLSAFIGQSASGEFTANVGTSLDVNGKVSVVGRTPDHIVTVGGHAFVDASGGISFHLPIRIAVGPNASEFTADGACTTEKTGRHLDLELTAVDVALDHLQRFAGSVATASGASLPRISIAGPDDHRPASGAKDEHPFWADWMARVKVEFYRLHALGHDFEKVAGTLTLDHTALHFEGGHATLAAPPPETAPAAKGLPRYFAKKELPPSVLTAEGTLSFDATAEQPYSLTATATVDVVDATRLFPTSRDGPDPMVEGRFSLTDTLTSHGLTLADLASSRQEEFRLASKSGIVRLLKTSVAEAIPQAATPVSDALTGAVGSVVGTIFGVKANSIGSGKNPLGKAAEAVLDFTYQTKEIGYDQLSVTAVRRADRTLDLTEITMSGSRERLTGTGKITFDPTRPLRAQPLSLDLRVAARGDIADLLATAGLVNSDKDAQGFRTIQQSVHFGGTIEKIDATAWHDLLAKAATQKPEPAKKGG